MSKSLHVRGVPEAFHRRLEERAAEEEVSVSEYVLHAVEQALKNPKLSLKEERQTMQRMLAEIIAGPPLGDHPEPFRLILEEREMLRRLDERYRREGLEERARRRRSPSGRK